MCIKYHMFVVITMYLFERGSIQQLNCNFDKTLELDVSSLVIHFYDFKENITIKTPIFDACEQLSKLDINVDRRLALFVPGYRSIINGHTADWTKETFQKTNAYLLILDYSSYTHKLNQNNYEKAVTYTIYIGRAVGKFLAGLHRNGYPSENILCFGHSFGGPMLGFIAEAYIEETSEKIGRVTAIEPAKPCFDGEENRLISGVADCVEVFHCTVGNMSIGATVADVDIFLNIELETQPDCYDGFYLRALGRVDSETCSHVICYKYWAWTVLDPNSYIACDFDSYLYGRCVHNYSTVGYHGICDIRGVLYASTDTFVGPI